MSTESPLRFNKNTLESVRLPSPGKRVTFRDTEVPGLQLRVTDRGIKSFCVFRRIKGGVPERITIGRFPTLSVERARTKAKRYLAELGEGISVSARRRNTALETRTLDAVHREYLASRGVMLVEVRRKNGKPVEKANLAPNAKLKAITARDYNRVIAKLFADWRSKPIVAITRDMIGMRTETRSLPTMSPLIGHAQKDLEAGLVDTDNYTRATEVAQKSRRTLPRGR